MIETRQTVSVSPRPLFVLGAPRSGTTLIGNFVASHPACYDLGEFYGLYFTGRDVPDVLERMSSRVKNDYMRALFDATVTFLQTPRSKSPTAFWCDQTAWNLFIVKKLRDTFPSAVFIVMLRHYRGVVQSLRRSYSAGYVWAGKTIAESARLWATIYRNIEDLPRNNVIPVSFERLCASPAISIARLEDSVSRALAIAPAFDRRVLASNRATWTDSPAIAKTTRSGIVWRPRPSAGRDWSEMMEEICLPIVSTTNALLLSRFSDEYAEPWVTSETHGASARTHSRTRRSR